jgi:hypothetical protein
VKRPVKIVSAMPFKHNRRYNALSWPLTMLVKHSVEMFLIAKSNPFA